MNQKGLFDDYIQNGTPEQVERARNWSIAIGMQQVDLLTVSDYLIELARKNIEGKLSMSEVNKLLDQYYDERHKDKAAWKEYETYTRVDRVADPIGAKKGRPI